MKKIFLTAIVIFTMASPVFVSAQTSCPPGKTGLQCAGGLLDKVAGEGSGTGLSGNLATTVATVIKAVLALVGTIFLVLTIYAGVLWMTAQGEETKIEKAKETIKASVIGLIVIMSAYAITAFVTSRLVGTGSASNQPNTPSNASVLCGQVNDEVTCLATQDSNGYYPCSWVANKCTAP